MYGYVTAFIGSGTFLHISVNTLPGLHAIAIALELSAANLLRNSCDMKDIVSGIRQCIVYNMSVWLCYA
jgi:hypothetical protein